MSSILSANALNTNTMISISKIPKGLLWLFGVLLTLSGCATSQESAVSSPDGKVRINLAEEGPGLSYQLNWNGQEVIAASELSIFPERQAKVMDVSITEVNEKWNPVWGQFSEVVNHYKELTISLDYEGIPATLYVRAYDKGVAFRFEVAAVPEKSKPSFFMEYGLSQADQFFMPAGEREPIGPIKVGSLSKMDSVELAWKMPLVIETYQQQFMSFLESDLVSAPGFGVIKFGFDKQSGQLMANNPFSSAEKKLITPWRVILMEEELGDLVTNTLPLNVAAPCQIEDPSWIKPGKTLWDWRVHGYESPDGFTYGIDTESYLRFIDFAAEKEIEYFLIDDSWYTDVAPDSIVFSAKLDVEKVSSYAEEKGVSLLLYYDRRKGNYGDDALFPYYQSLGMKGIKYGFMGTNVPFTREAIRLSAESNLLIDFHDSPVPFTGISRTYPNAVTREYCHAQQDSRRAFTPAAFIKMALINAIQGPLDMNNGIFDISGVNAGGREKGPLKLNSLLTTATGETARTLVVFSGLVCIPDAPEAYEAKSDLFEFIQKLPVGKWDESKILQAEMGEYITTARRHGQEWFIGSVHNEGGVLDIAMDFLAEGQNYTVTYYEDTEETDCKTNPEAYRVRKGSVKKGAIVQAKIASGGGHCMWIRPEHTAGQGER